jgi:hypothetical protein
MPTGYQVDETTWGDLCRSLVTTLMNLPRLRQLTLVLPEEWDHYKNDDGARYVHSLLLPNTEEAWWYMSELLRAKRFLDVRVVHLLMDKYQYSHPDYSSLSKKSQAVPCFSQAKTGHLGCSSCSA